jgi:hypothetical protein
MLNNARDSKLKKETCPLKPIRIGVGGLGIASLVWMLYIVFFVPLRSETFRWHENAFLCFGLPILALNFFFWFFPDGWKAKSRKE